MSDVQIEIELDCRSMVCPMPIIVLARRFGEVSVGGIVAVVATDVAARTDVPAWCRMRGQDYVGEDLADDEVPRYLVRRIS